MYRIFDRNTNETVATVVTNHSISLDDAIGFVGKIHHDCECYDANVEINGRWYYYDDLDVDTKP